MTTMGKSGIFPRPPEPAPPIYSLAKTRAEYKDELRTILEAQVAALEGVNTNVNNPAYLTTLSRIDQLNQILSMLARTKFNTD